MGTILSVERFTVSGSLKMQTFTSLNPKDTAAKPTEGVYQSTGNGPVAEKQTYATPNPEAIVAEQEVASEQTATAIVVLNALIDNGQYLGEGGYGKVYKILFNGQVAVAKVAKRNAPNIRRSFFDEASVLKKVDGAGGSPTLFAFSNNEDEAPVLVTSFCEGRTYYDLLVDKSVSKDKVFKVLSFFALSLDQIHQKRIIHNDFHSKNVLIEFSSLGEPIVHIIDFGLSKSIGKQMKLQIDPYLDTFYAPEICSGGECSAMSDVFSFGYMIREAIEIRGIRSYVPPVFKEIMHGAMSMDLEDRPSLLEIQESLLNAYPKRKKL